MKKKRKLGRKLLSFLLALAMVVGLTPGIALAATYDTTVDADSLQVNDLLGICNINKCDGYTFTLAEGGWVTESNLMFAGESLNGRANAATASLTTKGDYYNADKDNYTFPILRIAEYGIYIEGDYALPFYNGTVADYWKVTSVDHSAKTVTLSGYTPPMSTATYPSAIQYGSFSAPLTCSLETKAANTCIVVDGTVRTWSEDQWYVVTGDVTIKKRITVSGTANLILMDGATLTAEKGITLSSGNTLNIYAQKQGTGALIATGSGSDAGIGGVDTSDSVKTCGTLNIHGGQITATAGGAWCAGIGGGFGKDGGTVTIYRGTVTATGGNYSGAGIGAGGDSGNRNGKGGTVYIYGGTVTTTGKEGGMGIGAGNGNPDNGTLILGEDVALYGSNDSMPAGEGTTDKVDTTVGENVSTRNTYMKAVGPQITPIANLIPVTITAANKEVTYSADGITIPVDGMFIITDGAGAATYSVENGTGEGTYDAQTGKLTVTKCGTFTVKVSTAATDTHAAGAETTATLTVNKVAPTVTAPTAKTLTYNGQKQELVNAGSTNDGTLYYVVTTENIAPADNLYTTDIPAKTDAGTYYVWYKVVGDTNHNDTTSSKVEVNIKQADVKVTAPTAINSTYNGKEQALVNAGVTEDGKVFYRLGTDGTWTNTVPTAKNVGEYEVYYYVDGDDNHSDSGSAEEPLGSVKVTIAKKTVTVSGITAEGKEYDGNTGATISTENATLAGLVDGDTLT